MPRSTGPSALIRLRSLLVAVVLGGGTLLTACAPEAIVRESETGSRLALSTVFNEADLIRVIQDDLTCLFQAGLLPNEAAGLGKFRQVVAAKLAGDEAGAQNAADGLTSFINLKYSQYTGPATITCGAPIGPIAIEELTNRVIARINAFVSLDGNICEIPQGSPATFCSTGPAGDEEKALVYFPAAIFSELTYVLIEKNPPGFNRLQNLGLDEYPTYVRVVTAPRRNFTTAPLKPLVVVCFNENVVPEDASVRERLLLGHKRSSDGGFELMPTPDYGAYGGSVLQDVQQFCGLDPLASQAMFPTTNAFGRAANSIVGFFTPQPLYAAFGSFRGVGGSAEEFSEFGAVDRGMKAFGGGLGGSAEEFSRAEPGLASAIGAAITDVSFAGVAGVDTEVTSAARLPSVKVLSPLGTPVPGVEVTFALANPVTPNEAPRSPSNAALCGSATAVTDAAGMARPACVNFGTLAGFKNLKATFDPTKVDGSACIIDPVSGECATATTSINHLLETVAGAPTAITADNPVGGDFGGPFQVGQVLAPRVKVTDAFSNTVAGATVLWSLADPSRGSVNPSSGATAAGGLASTSWTIGVGTNGLSAFLGTTSGPSVSFMAESFASLSCEAGTQNRKANLGGFVAARGGYVGHFSMQPELAARMRKLTLQMSVTGQSSGTGNYPAEINVYRGSKIPANLIATGVQSNPNGIQLDGNNGNAQPVDFTLTPTGAAPAVSNNNFVIFEVLVKTPSTRTIQLWYNSRPTAGSTCASSILYAPGITSGFESTAARNKTPGLLLRLTN